MIKEGSVICWKHINLHGEFDFRRQIFGDTQFKMPPKRLIKIPTIGDAPAQTPVIPNNKYPALSEVMPAIFCRYIAKVNSMTNEQNAITIRAILAIKYFLTRKIFKSNNCCLLFWLHI